MKPIRYLSLLLGSAFLLQGCASSKPKMSDITPDQARGYFEVFRSNFNAKKVRTINEVMKLSVAEADKFWPIYRNYEKDMAPLSDRKLDLIRDFLTHRKEGTLTEDRAKELATRWLQNAQDRLDLWKKYQADISQAVSPMRAAQFLQVENQMGLCVDVYVASEMPLIGSKPEASK